MARPIGYYVHHHGDGHRQRAMSIAAALGDRIVLIGTGLAGRTGAVRAIDLPDDRMSDIGFGGIDGAEGRPRSLHYAPIDHDGVRRRVAVLTGWIAEARPALIVVDVSVEVAMLARLAATPTVYVRLAGLRDDAPHRDAFRGARALLAPFDAALDDPAVPAWVRARTTYVSGLGTFPKAQARPGDGVLVIVGAGGSAWDGARLAAAARATPTRQWRVAGPVSAPADMPPNLRLLGWVNDIGAEIAAAGIVVGGAGDGVTGAVLAAGRPFVCLPESRPFDEQASKARQLAGYGAAVVPDAWPEDAAWNTLLAAASRLDGANAARLHDPAGPQRAAAFLMSAVEHRP